MKEESSMAANLRTSSKDTVGRFEGDDRCKKHPKHWQSPGVCSLCLRKKLTQISWNSRKAAAAASTCSSSLSSCDSSSSCASPVHRRLRFTTEGKRSSSSMSIFLLSPKPGLAKSQSLAVFPTRKHDDSGKKGGFWSRFLHPKGKRKEDAKLIMMHSRSVKQEMALAMAMAS